MNPVTAPRYSPSASVPDLTRLAPLPTTVAKTGLPLPLLQALLLKHLLAQHEASAGALAASLKLPSGTVTELVQQLRAEALIELGGSQLAQALSFRLTDKGRVAALTAQEKSGYAGPAPIPLPLYRQLVEAFSLRHHTITHRAIEALFSGFIIDPDLRDQLGAALNAHKSIFVYGPAGTGKTYTISKLCQLYGDSCLIPYAIYAGDVIIQVFDPQVHRPLAEDSGAASIAYGDAHDYRLLRCQRPVVVAGGELNLDQLDITLEAETRLYNAPLQLKANGGIFIIDDMGRQKAPPRDIFNRWIIPLEEARDFLSPGNGQHIEVPFDQQLFFSSNIHPLALADEAFLRRIGFKIRFHYLDKATYLALWQQALQQQQLEFEEAVFEHLLTQGYARHNTPMTACHPRDLLVTALARMDYLDEPRRLTAELIDWSWRNYFVALDDPEQSHAAPP